MDLSIVIISWNTEGILRDCLDSVFAALDSSIEAEVIVVDNASEDGSAEMVRDSFPDVSLIVNDDNRGFAAANNQGFEIARGRHVLLLNSDTLVLGRVLQDSVVFMDAHPEVGVFGCRVLNPDRTMQRTCFQYPTLTNLLLLASGLDRLSWPRFLGRHQMSHWLRDSERDVDVVTGCYMLVRRSAMDEVGTLDESFFFCGEETDWCRRFREAGWHVRFSPVGEIVHLGNASGRKFEGRRDLMLTTGLVRYHRKHGGWPAAAAAWLVLLGFNASRMVFWAAASLLGGDRSKRRFHHFSVVVRNFLETWPAAGDGAR